MPKLRSLKTCKFSPRDLVVLVAGYAARRAITTSMASKVAYTFLREFR